MALFAYDEIDARTKANHNSVCKYDVINAVGGILKLNIAFMSVPDIQTVLNK